MQLILIEKEAAANFSIPAGEVFFPAIIVDERDSKIKIVNKKGELGTVGNGSVDMLLATYAHRKRFGIVSPDVVENDTLSVDAMLTAQEIESLSKSVNPININTTK